MTVADFSRHHFLIVDDKQFLRNLMQGVLLQCHAGGVKHAMHGAGAINVLTESQGRIDLVLCDWNMEPVNGLELLRMVRTGQLGGVPRDLRFIMTTGYSEEAVVKAAIGMDISGFLVKPVAAEQLIKSITSAFAKTVNLKAVAAYQKAADVNIPGVTVGEGSRIPPWALVSNVKQTARDALAQRLAQIQGTSESSPQRKIKNARMMPLEEIEAGKVLAEDIHNEAGRLLLSTGTVLDQTLLRRLHEVMVVSHESIRLRVGEFEE